MTAQTRQDYTIGTCLALGAAACVVFVGVTAGWAGALFVVGAVLLVLGGSA